MSARRFRVGSAPTRSAAKALPRGTTLRFALSEAATVAIAIKRPGRAPSTLTRSGAQGANRIVLSGRIGRKALPPGRYTLSLTAVDAAGNRSATRNIGFRIG